MIQKQRSFDSWCLLDRGNLFQAGFRGNAWSLTIVFGCGIFLSE
jgi:hypothetical protein